MLKSEVKIDDQSKENNSFALLRHLIYLREAVKAVIHFMGN
jgi:hypothetical protein